MRSIMLSYRPDIPPKVYTEEIRDKLHDLVGLEKTVYSKEMVMNTQNDFSDVSFVFSTWGMPCFTEEEIRQYLPSLRCVFYAAGTVQRFARPFLHCGVRVFSASQANAVPVAEYTVAEIVLASKGFYQLSQMASCGRYEEAKSLRERYPGNYDINIGIIGVGAIGRMVAEKLKNFRVNVFAFDPFLSDENAKELNVRKCSLQEIFVNCDVVTNHLADNSQTKGIINYDLFASMKPYATFINTGRGAQVVEEDLVAVLSQRADLSAVLDVTMPEPPEKGSQLYELKNVFLSPHIAGSIGNEVHRMAEYIFEECDRFIHDQEVHFEVTEKMLETMA